MMVRLPILAPGSSTTRSAIIAETESLERTMYVRVNKKHTSSANGNFGSSKAIYSGNVMMRALEQKEVQRTRCEKLAPGAEDNIVADL